MPLYEYLCDGCGRRFELIRKFSDPPLEKCPSCGGAVQKLVSSPAFQFKGTGFYITDYVKKEQPSTAQAEEARADAAASKDKQDKGAEKSGEKGGEKGATAEKPDTSQKNTKSDKGTAATESAATPKSPAPSPKDTSKGRS